MDSILASSDGVFSELVAWALLWPLSWTNVFPHLQADLAHGQYFHLDHVVNHIPASSSISAATLVVFQQLLIERSTEATWTIPLIMVGVFTADRLTCVGEDDDDEYVAVPLWAHSSSRRDWAATLAALSSLTSILIWWQTVGFVAWEIRDAVLLACGVTLCILLPAQRRKLLLDMWQDKSRSQHSLIRHLAPSAYLCCIVTLVASSSLLGADLPQFFSIQNVSNATLLGMQAVGLITTLGSGHITSATSMLSAAAVFQFCVSQSSLVKQIIGSAMFIGIISQAVLSLPTTWTRRAFVLIFLLLPSIILPLMHQTKLPTFSADISYQPSTSDAPKLDTSRSIHPIERLHLHWLQADQEKVDNQSRDLESAVAEYRRRYNREPPRGFAHWFHYAVANDYIMVDEFDTLMQSIEPYWSIPTPLMRSRIDSVSQDVDLRVFVVKDGNVTYGSRNHYLADVVKGWVEKFGKVYPLPEMTFVMNVLDEPRVSVPVDQAVVSKRRDDMSEQVIGKSHVTYEELLDDEDEDQVAWLNLAHKHIWHEIRSSCPGPTSRGSPHTSFLESAPSDQDYCASSALLDQHGFFQAPTTLYLAKVLVPIMSQSAPRHFHDILFPSPHHWMVADQKPDERESEWHNKTNQLYWAGSSTGGYHTPENWMNLHRPYITMMTGTDSDQPVALLHKSGTGKWQPKTSIWSKISALFHIRITNIVQCEGSACDAMRQEFSPELQPTMASGRYKYALDLDGNSFSGRFFRLLKSKSCVVKSTIFREWHDDILTPWVHYVPLSTGADELGEMMRYLIHEPEGDSIGQAIADRGRRWANKVLRKEDMEIYFWRALLEVNRVMHEHRDQHFFGMTDPNTRKSAYG